MSAPDTGKSSFISNIKPRVGRRRVLFQTRNSGNSNSTASNGAPPPLSGPRRRKAAGAGPITMASADTGVMYNDDNDDDGGNDGVGGTGAWSGLAGASRSKIPSIFPPLSPAPNPAPAPKTAAPPPPPVPDLFTCLPFLEDELYTETSRVQNDTVRACLPLLECGSGTSGGDGGNNAYPATTTDDGSNNNPTYGRSSGTGSSLAPLNAFGLPHLERGRHARFLRRCLETYSAGFVAYDSSRPWILYWSLAGLSLLGEDVSGYRERVIQNLTAAQNLSGGFGGCHGQMSHCAPSYAAVLSLAMVGGADALSVIDRKALWEWLGRVKQPDGGFAVAEGAEEDVRGAYCSMVMIALLNLPLELPPDAPARQHGLNLFTDKLPEWLSSCQTYEGGISGSPDSEAHGGYAFCALACFCLMGAPTELLPAHLDLPLLLSWLSARQYAPEGGFSGRTNKLVDSCYSHWVGGCWPLLDAATVGSAAVELWSREGLARYLLCCCQLKEGGLRDKPGKKQDGYHTCYALAGLSCVQHRSRFDPVNAEAGVTNEQETEAASFVSLSTKLFSSSLSSSPTLPSSSSALPSSSSSLPSAFGWLYDGPSPVTRGEGEEEEQEVEQETRPSSSIERRIFEDIDLLSPTHPLFVIPYDAVERTRAFFGGVGVGGSSSSSSGW